MSTFTGKRDNYSGVAVDLNQEPYEDFAQQLERKWPGETSGLISLEYATSFCEVNYHL
jgi:hypothetical protein